MTAVGGAGLDEDRHKVQHPHPNLRRPPPSSRARPGIQGRQSTDIAAMLQGNALDPGSADLMVLVRDDRNNDKTVSCALDTEAFTDVAHRKTVKKDGVLTIK
ncbi:MAG: hypothetical protein AAGJ87_00150, partial [Pseudomonadota bacterium]